MIYRAIGVMSGSSLDGLDIAFAEFQEDGSKAAANPHWTYLIRSSRSYHYNEEWVQRLKNATTLDALNYQLLHVEFGNYIGERVRQFIDEYKLHYQVALVSSHGHTTFHIPAKQMTAQLGDGAAIGAKTELPVVTDLRSLDVAFGGQGAPIVPIGERMLLPGFDYFLNLGGIANVSVNREPYIAFDVCPANRVLNMLSNDAGKEYDNGGEMASGGEVDDKLLDMLNELGYYRQPYPKSFDSDFG